LVLLILGYYPRTILSDELTKINASEIGTTTIITARKILLRKALNEGVIYLNLKPILK
jgi:hypothetical protein